MIDLGALERAIRKDDKDGVVRMFLGVPEAERKLTRPLLATLERQEAAHWRGDDRTVPPVGRYALDLAQLATTPSPEGAARVLRWGFTQHRLRLILDREVRWKPALVELLTSIRVESEAGFVEVPWETVDPLLAQLGVTHLDTPDYALQYLRRQDPRLDADAQLAVDPALPGLLLRAFDTDRLHDATPSRWTNEHSTGRERPWAEIAGRWAAAGILDRGELQRRAVATLVRGGMQPHVRAAMWFLEELGPSAEEIAALLRDYLALLESRQSFVAGHALKALRSLDAVSPLAPAVVADACARVMNRPDATLPQAALGWLRALLKRDAGAAAEVARAASVGLAHPKRVVQEKSLALVSGLRLDDESAAEVAWAMDAVDPTVRGAVTTTTRLPDVPSTAPIIPLARVGSPDELVDVVRRGHTVGPNFGDDEVLLDGFAVFGTALDERQRAEVLKDEWADEVLRELRAAFGPPRTLTGALKRLVSGARAEGRPTVLRAREVSAQVRAGRSAVLASFPHDASGLVDPERLLDELRRASAEGRRLGPLDLEAAWLRLPVGLSPDLVRDLEAIPGDDAAWLARHVADGPLAPPMLTLDAREDPRNGSMARFSGTWPVTAGRGGELLRRIERLIGLTARHSPPVEVPDIALVPTQRELLAAYHLRDLAGWGGLGQCVEPLTLLPHQQGAVGQAVHVTLASAATQEHAATRAAALDATLGLLATGDLDGDDAGPHWALLAGLSEYKLTRWTAHLRDVAASSVAGSRYTWGVLRHVLGVVLPADPSKRAGIADLVGLAAESALTVGGSGTLPGLDDVADRPGRSRLGVEARRLRAVLQGR